MKLALDLKIHHELHHHLECLKGFQIRIDSEKEVMEVFRSDMSDIETAIRVDRSMISSVEGQIRMFAHSMIEPNFFEMLTNFYHPLPIFLMSFLGCLCSLFGYSLVFFHSSKIYFLILFVSMFNSLS